jgi:site-specific DNA-methyltransferase (adenine-specific)
MIEPTINLYQIDCNKFMADVPDKYYELAIVDPPYGINGHKQRVFNDYKKWDINRPNEKYFTELKRISKNQIVWGGNYFKELWPCKGYIIWDKHQPEGITFAMVELATTTIDKPAKMFFTKPAGERGFYTVDSKRIHPTQKPIALYKWLLTNYAKKGDKILDTHGGSMSIAIACYDLGFNLDLCEMDKDYFRDGKARFEAHRTKQRELKELGYAKTELQKINPVLF